MENENKVDISFVVPVYNTDCDKFKRCINSILELKTIDCELIVIDDGSKKENSAKYIELIKDFSEIRYIKTENHGVSSARNTRNERS